MFVILILGILLFFHALFASSSKVPEPKIPFPNKKYVCYKAAEPIIVDGALKEKSWLKARWTDEFVDIEGALKPIPRFKTRAKMLWDDEYFYIGAAMKEPHVWATLTKRDSIIFHDNDFEVFIDAGGTTHTYYELEMNALNTVWDLFLVKPYRDGGPAVHSWDIQGLKTAVFVDGTLNSPLDKDRGWSVEIALPWEVLKECAPGKKPPKPGEQWRLNFSRVEYKVEVENSRYAKVKDPATGKSLPEDNWVWSPTGLINIHYPEMWGYVQFSGKRVGSGKDAFDEIAEEKVKWALRRIYYREWAYKAEHGHFTSEFDRLNLKELEIVGYDFPPLIKVTDSLFEAIFKHREGPKWHIREDGFIWKD